MIWYEWLTWCKKRKTRTISSLLINQLKIITSTTTPCSANQHWDWDSGAEDRASTPGGSKNGILHQREDHSKSTCPEPPLCEGPPYSELTSSFAHHMEGGKQGEGKKKTRKEWWWEGGKGIRKDILQTPSVILRGKVLAGTCFFHLSLVLSLPRACLARNGSQWTGSKSSMKLLPSK